MAKEPFISKEERPNLNINLEGRVGDLTVRELATILGTEAATGQKLKELPATALDKVPIKETQKDVKDRKDVKEHKDQKEPKDRKDQKDTKDHKDPKEQKDQKDQKEHKDHKDQKDTKDQKDHKDPKETKDQKDHKDPKEHKDLKDHKELKEGLKEVKEVKEGVAELPTSKTEPETGPGPVTGGTELDSLIQRISGLEQSVNELKQASQK